MNIHALQYSLIQSTESESREFMPTMLAVHTLRPEDTLKRIQSVVEDIQAGRANVKISDKIPIRIG